MFKKTTFLILLFIISGFCHAQKNEENPLKSYYKCGLFYVPTFFLSASLNYERQISKFSSVELSANFFEIYGEYHNSLYGLGDRKKRAEFWTSTRYSDEYGFSGDSYCCISLSRKSEGLSLYNSNEDFETFEKKSIRCIKN